MKRINKNSALLPQVQRGKPITITVDGRLVNSYKGETVATALLSAGITIFRLSHQHKQPRGLYCGMGVCYECLVTINGIHAQRACVTLVEDGMSIETCKELE